MLAVINLSYSFIETGKNCLKCIGKDVNQNFSVTENVAEIWGKSQ